MKAPSLREARVLARMGESCLFIMNLTQIWMVPEVMAPMGKGHVFTKTATDQNPYLMRAVYRDLIDYNVPYFFN